MLVANDWRSNIIVGSADSRLTVIGGSLDGLGANDRRGEAVLEGVACIERQIRRDVLACGVVWVAAGAGKLLVQALLLPAIACSSSS